jgi:ferric-dicitrate binding protein FerR (iron transport regulator)
MFNRNTGCDDLLSDESFLAWYLKTDERAVRRWENWIAECEENELRVNEAVRFLTTIVLKEAPMGPERVMVAEQRLLRAIRALNRERWVGIAASILVVVISTCMYIGYTMYLQQDALRAAFGEVRREVLSDGTEITLNANSTIRYSPGWKAGKDREVWLTGEAYFHVTKTPRRTRFIVHTNQFDIIVRGTSFNAVSRPDRVSVLLKEGSVLLQPIGGRDHTMEMRPGDFVEYHADCEDGRMGCLEKKDCRADSITAWKEHRVVFNNTPLKEVARMIEEHYGVRVELGDAVVGDRVVFGVLANDDVDVLLKALQATADFRLEREGDRIRIYAK